MTSPRYKVLHLVPSLNPGGLAKVVMDLVEGFDRRGSECWVGCLEELGQWSGDLKGCRGLWEGHLKTRNGALVLLGLCRFLKRNGIELIHSHNPKPHVYGAAASLLTGIPLVHTKHGRNYPGNARWVWMSRQLSRCTRFVVAVSEDARRVVTEIEKVPVRKVRVIRNGIDAASFSLSDAERGALRRRQRQLCGVADNAFVVGSVGRLSSEKNYPLLVEAFASFRHSMESAGGPSVLVLVGEGEHRSAIEEAARRWDVSDALILPGMQKDVRAWLTGLDVFCLSSDTEGTALTLLEAAASGLPSVVTDVGGNAEVIRDRIDGIVVPAGNAEQLAAALREIRTNDQVSRRMGLSARDRIQTNYSLSQMVDGYAQLYDDIRIDR